MLVKGRCVDDFDHLAHKVRGALIFLKAQLPPWVFSGVMQRLKVQQMRPPYHEIRWLMVREARIEKKLLAQEAYEYVSKKLANTPARAKTDAIMKSFQKVESECSVERSTECLPSPLDFPATRRRNWCRTPRLRASSTSPS